MRTQFTYLYLLLLGCLGILPVLSAQTEKATLNILLQSEYDEAIPSAVVRIDSTKAYNTDSEGRVSIQLDPDKKYLISISHLSYATYKFYETLKPGETKKMRLRLNSNTYVIEVEINEETDRELPLVTIDPENILYQVGVGDPTMMLIKSIANVSTNNELSSGYSVRGGNFDENIIYVNDIEVYRPFLARSGQQEGLSFINGDMVGGIKFSSGGFEARYGDKMSSVLDITYRRPLEFRATVQGSLLGAQLHVEDAILKNRLKYNLGFRYRSNNYVLSSLDTKGEYKPNFMDFQGTIGYDISDEWELNLFGSYSDNNYIQIPQTRTTVFGHVQEAKQLTVYFDGQEKTRFRVGTGAASLIFRPNARQIHKLILSGYNTRETEKFDVLGQYFLGEVEADLGSENFGEVTNTIGVGGFLNHARNELNGTVYSAEFKSKIYQPFYGKIIQNIMHQFGARFTYEQIDDRLKEWNILDSTGYLLPYAGPWDTNAVEVEGYRNVQNNINSQRYQAYYQTSFSWFKDSNFVDLTIGVRGQYWSLNQDFLVSPRIQFAWQPHFKPNKKGIRPDILFRLAGGIYYQAPFYREMRDFDGVLNTDIKAQRSYQVVLGFDYNFRIWNRPFKIVTEAYYKHLENLIPYELDNVRIRYYGTNNSRGYAAGVDFRLGGEFIEGLDSWLTMSVLSTQEDLSDDFYLDNNGDTIHPGYIPRPTDQRFTLGLFFQDHIPKLEWIRVHLNMLFGSKLPFGPPNQERYTDVLRAPFYRRVDIGFSFVLIRPGQEFKKPSKFKSAFRSLWASFEVFNLLDIDNTVSYFWVRDISSRQYAVPNYLTGRLFNVKLVAQF